MWCTKLAGCAVGVVIVVYKTSWLRSGSSYCGVKKLAGCAVGVVIVVYKTSWLRGGSGDCDVSLYKAG